MDHQIVSTGSAARDDYSTIFVAIELSRKSWVVALHTPLSDKVSLHRLGAGDKEGLLALLASLRSRVKRALGRAVRVLSCYEAGFDGFWLHRCLQARGVENAVLDPSSLQVNRRARRAKTDRIDARAMLRTLMAYWRGERQVCSMVRVPSREQEDARRPHRERERLVKEATQHRNRINGLLALHGIYGFGPQRRDSRARLAELCCADGSALPPLLRREVERELERLALVQKMIAELEAERDAALAAEAPGDEGLRKAKQLITLKSIGASTASLLGGEVYYRDFANRRQLGSFVGLVSCPFDSGSQHRDQGISKAGNRRARTTMIQLAWRWLRFQPDSALSKWFHSRLQAAEGRFKRILIVALARKLLIALWRFVETGLVPSGAVLKA